MHNNKIFALTVCNAVTESSVHFMQPTPDVYDERTSLLSNTEVWELMALVALRLLYCSDFYIGLYISKPVFFFLFGSRFTSLCLTYVYVINRYICK